MFIGDLQVATDGRFQLTAALMHAASQLLLRNNANHLSTRFSQDAPVGVKCRWKRGRLANQLRISDV